MIYLCINAKNIKDLDGKSILGKKADELVGITCSVGKDTLLETSKAFIIASQDHRNDMLDPTSTVSLI